MSHREPPSGLDPKTIEKKLDALPKEGIWRRYHCTLVTPMYGGGVNAGEVDKDMPIRATAIRGQLRFWWRLLNRHNHKENDKSLFSAERALWGGLGDEKTLAASKVVVRIDAVTGLTTEACATYPKKPDGTFKTYPNWKGWAHGYAMFPAQGKANKSKVEKEPKLLALPGLSWRLEIGEAGLSETELNSVLEALRWWAAFGGVGARTRRGLGAVQVVDMAGLELLLSEVDIRAQGLAIAYKPPLEKAPDAWKQAIDAMKNFRQGVGVGRNAAGQGSKSPAGRSRWPEPDEIRRQTDKHSACHQPNHPVQGVFPRAAFGMPIIFHFNDGDDPGDSELVPVKEGKKQERMASPLILRPWRTTDGKWRPAALLLPHDHVWQTDVQLGNSGKGHNQHLPKDFKANRWWPGDAQRRGQLANQIAPMSGRVAVDPLAAFMDFFVRGK